jgi:hypothetical protein
MYGSKTVLISQLPAIIAPLLRAGKINTPDIRLTGNDEPYVAPISNDGQRCTQHHVNVATGEVKTFVGSWGGANMFERTIDHVKSKITLGDDEYIVRCYTGYPRASAVVECNMKTFETYKTDSVDMTDKEAKGLSIVCHCSSSYRKESWRRDVGGAYDAAHAVVVSLVEKGLVKVAKNGSISATVAGKMALDQRELEKRSVSHY